MSFDPYSNPPAGNYDPAPKPPAKELEGASDAPRPQYFAAFNYVFEHPDWAMSVLLGSVCMLIPILSAILLQGYRYEIVEMKLRFPDQQYPKFDFNRFSNYLQRGIWPFLIDFIIQFILNIPIQISVWVCMGLVAAANESKSQAMIVVAGVGIPLLILGVILFLVALFVVLVPFMIRAGLSQDFSATFNFAWIKDFLRKVGLQALLFNLFVMAAGFVLFPLGYLACCIGLIPISFILMGPVMAHYHWQLYRMYLAKGGEPIPLKPLQLDPTTMPPPGGYTPGGNVPPNPYVPPNPA